MKTVKNREEKSISSFSALRPKNRLNQKTHSEKRFFLAEMREFEADSLDSSRSPSPTNVYGESFTIQRLQKAVNRLEVEHDRILRDNMRLETELESAQTRLKAKIFTLY